MYDGCPLNKAQELACSDSQQVQFCAEAGRTYYIRIGATDHVGGTFGLQAIGLGVRIQDGPIQNPSNGHWYYVTNFGNWEATEAFAATLGGHLVTIDDAAENEWVRVNIENFGGSATSVWIGLSDTAVDGTFTWTSGAAVGYTNWGGGEPSALAAEDYVLLDPFDGAWLARENCGGFHTGVIEVDDVIVPAVLDGPIRNPANCRDYSLTQPGTWFEAQMRAELLGGDLVTIDDATENEWVRSTFANYGGSDRTVWIGLHDANTESSFEWLSGAPTLYSNWNPGEPNNLGNEDYVAMNNPVTGG